jgi:dolichol-phosphate mannosyltransferase
VASELTDLGDPPPMTRIVLPAYNESASLRELLDRIATVMTYAGQPFEMVVVDDGSTDDTASIADEAAATLPVQVLRHPHNVGLGAAIADGLRSASQRSGPDDAIVTMDADLTQDPGYIPAMIEAWRHGADVVIASRFRPGSRVHGLSPYRRFMTFGARVVMSALVPVPGVRDYSSGYRLYAAPVLQDAFASMGDGFITQTGFACMVEILVKLRDSVVIAEVPFELRYDAKRNRSSMRVGRTVASYLRVIADARRARRSAGPGRARR